MIYSPNNILHSESKAQYVTAWWLGHEQHGCILETQQTREERKVEGDPPHFITSNASNTKQYIV